MFHVDSVTKTSTCHAGTTNANFHSLQGLQSIRFDHVLQSFEQQILNKEGDE